MSYTNVTCEEQGEPAEGSVGMGTLCPLHGFSGSLKLFKNGNKNKRVNLKMGIFKRTLAFA